MRNVTAVLVLFCLILGGAVGLNAIVSPKPDPCACKGNKCCCLCGDNCKCKECK